MKQLISKNNPYKSYSSVDMSQGNSSRNTGESSDYDPHDHRVVEHPTTNTETLIHLIKGSLGTGILAMPNAFLNSGLLIGFVGTILIGILCTYSLQVLIRSQYTLCKKLQVPKLSYPDSMKYALQDGPKFLKFGIPLSAFIVDGFLSIFHLGICCVYIMFIGSSIKQVMDHYIEPMNVRYYMLFMIVPLMVIMMIRNLKLLVPYSQVANIVTLLSFAFILRYIFIDLPPVSCRPLIGEPRNYILYVGTTLFALEAVGVVLALENNMKTPKSFRGMTGVFSIAMTIIVSLYLIMGFFGYVKYGENTKGSVTLNLPENEILAQSVKLAIAFAIFISYALQAYVPMDIIWNTYVKKRILDHNKTTVEYTLRIAIVILTFSLAVSVPRLELFISLFGALCLSGLGIAFPALIEICVLWPERNFGCLNYVLWKDIFLIIIGILAMFLGTYISVLDIVRSFQ